MENSSQALLIAGGILLGILTLSLLVYMFTNLSTIGNAERKNEEVERLASWNSEWESYNKRLLYGTDVLTIINKAEQNNYDNDNNSKYTVSVVVYFDDGVTVMQKSTVLLRKTSIFECVKMEYNSDTGRVNYVEFRLKE